MITVFSGKNLKYGDAVFVSGKLTAPKPFADFDYPDYLAAKNIYGQMFLPEIYILQAGPNSSIIRTALVLKHFLFARLERVLPQPQAGLMIALVSGNKNYLPAADAAAFNDTGAAHLIAVSGYKLTLIFIALESLAVYLSKRGALFASAVFGIFYLIMADFAPAVWRAAIMSALFSAARLSGRKYKIFSALVLTAAILLAFNPLIIRYDLGFMLSFSGITGIIFLNPLFSVFFRRVPDKFRIKEAGISSLSAQVATAPIMAHFFHQFSPIGPVINLLTVPLLASTIILGYLCAVPGLGSVAALLAGVPLNWMLWIVHIFDRLPGAWFKANISGRGLVWAYCLEIAGYFIFRALLKNRIRSGKIIE